MRARGVRVFAQDDAVAWLGTPVELGAVRRDLLPRLGSSAQIRPPVSIFPVLRLSIRRPHWAAGFVWAANFVWADWPAGGGGSDREADRGLDLGLEILGGDRLDQHRGGADLLGHVVHEGVLLAGQDDDREAADGVVLVAAHMVAEIHAVHLVHVQIADDDVRLLGRRIVQLLERLFAVLGVVDIANPDLTQQAADDFPHGPLIVDHENADRTGFRLGHRSL